MSQLKIYRNSFYYMAASFLPTVVNFIVLPIFTRYLSPADYGVLALIQSFSAFLPLILGLQIQSSIARFYFDYDSQEQKVLISTIALTLLFFCMIGFTVLFVFSNQILSFIFPKISVSTFMLFKIALLTAFFNTPGEYFKSLLIVREKAKLFMKVSMCLFWIGLAINITEVVILKKGAYGIIEAALITSVLSFIVFLFYNRHYLILKFDRTMLKGPIKFSLPIIPHALAGIIFMYSDRIIMEKYVTLSAIGLYALADKVGTLFKTAVNQLNAAFQPHFCKTAMEDKNKAISDARDISQKMVFAVSFLVCITALFSVEIVYYALDKRFFNAWMMIPILASSYVFRGLYCFESSGLFFEKKTGKVALITITAAAVNILINIAFMKKYGVIVAIFSTLASYILTYLMAIVMSMKTFYIKLDNKSNLYFICYMYVVMVLSYFINSKFTLENPHLSLSNYFLKILMIVFGLFLGLNTKTLGLNILKFFKKTSINISNQVSV